MSCLLDLVMEPGLLYEKYGRHKTRNVDFVISQCMLGEVLTCFAGCVGIKHLGRPFYCFGAFGRLIERVPRNSVCRLRLRRVGIEDTTCLGRHLT